MKNVKGAVYCAYLKRDMRLAIVAGNYEKAHGMCGHIQEGSMRKVASALGYKTRKYQCNLVRRVQIPKQSRKY